MPTLFAFNFNNISSQFDEKDEIAILNSLDIDTNFIGDMHYEEMKDEIDKVDILYFARTLQSGEIIIQTLKEMIKKSNVPDNFLYMAMVESKFLTTAKSNKSAAGLWQLMPKTAKHLHLTINSKIDERLDPIKSTQVAIQYLQYLYTRFGKWYLAAFAYNCGETRLAKAIKESGSDDIFTLLDDDYSYLPKETKRYIRKLIIASLIAHSDSLLKEVAKTSKNSQHIKLKTLKVNKGTSLKHIASSYNIPIKMLKQFNAHILKGVTPTGSKKYCINIPEDKFNSAKSICSSNENIFTYTVKEGDTLFLISKRFNNKMSAIKDLNPYLSKTLPVGEKLALIGEAKEKKKIKTIHKKSKLKEKTTRLHFDSATPNEKVMKKKIVKKVAISKKEITKIHKKRTKKTKKTDETFTYTTKKGETPFIISKKFNNRIATLKRLNGTLPAKFQEGRVLIIKR